VHWTYDTWALANGTGSAMVKRGGDSWYFLTADYAFGHALERDTSAVVTKSGGKVLGSSSHRIQATDFSSFLLSAQSSKAKVIGLANAGGDTINADQGGGRFRHRERRAEPRRPPDLRRRHQGARPADRARAGAERVLLLGPQRQTRAFSKRFAERHGGKMPTMVHAGVYAGALHYLKAVEALKDKDSAKVMAKMKEMPTDDPLFGKGQIRVDGRKIHPMYLFEVKKPSESKGEWDLYKLVSTIPAEQAFRPLNEGGCSLVKS
jgi:branched-chain amino acid transport system substrate-binding protein